MVKNGERFTYELLKSERREVLATPDRAAFVAWLSAQSPRTLDALVRPGCGDSIEIITPELLTEAVAARHGVDAPEPYGNVLAEEVADALDRGKKVVNDHRDYCGMGLAKLEADYVYGSFDDGGPPEAMRTFAARESFVAWLAAQSDASLSGRDEGPFVWGNQRITRARLLEAVR
jgi:hypothetical protein